MLNHKQFYADLQTLVNMDSGSYDAQGTTQVARWFAQRFEALGWKATWHDPMPEKRGKSVFLAPADTQEMDLFIVCHVDTVFPKGEVAKRPFSMDEKRLYGPGVGDMKAGCLFTLMALEELIAEKAKLGRMGVFFNTEEEISSVNTRPMIEAYAKKCRALITAEPARADGANVKQRKGVSRYIMTFEGKSAHAGNNPQDGVCAVTEMAHWILFMKTLEDIPRGITVNPGIAKGGSSANAVPDAAELHVDVRTRTHEDACQVDQAIRAHPLTNHKVKMQISGGISRPPMVPNAQSEELAQVLEEINKEIGLETKWAYAGGGSDASFGSPLNKATLCALGPRSGKAHSADEYVEIDDLSQRFAQFKEVIKRFSTHQYKIDF